MKRCTEKEKNQIQNNKILNKIYYTNEKYNGRDFESAYFFKQKERNI